jgi:hypothetical protein
MSLTKRWYSLEQAAGREEGAALRGGVCEAVLCLESPLEGVKNDIVSDIRRMILGALVIQIVAEVAAIFAVAELVAR